MIKRTVTAGVAAALLLNACGGDPVDDAGSSDDPASSTGTGVFAMRLGADPGNLDPQMSLLSETYQMSQLTYDFLLNLDPDSGEIVSGLATAWEVDGTTVTLTLADGITCSDGTPLTASDAADNIDFVGDPDNASPFIGVFLPAGATADADDDSGTVTVTLPEPAPFVLNGLAGLPIVCRAGLDDRTLLADDAIGTGPFTLTEVVPDERYVLTARDDYTWGPAGATTDEPGFPTGVEVSIVSEETTATNLLLAGDLNASSAVGPDRQRLVDAGLFASPSSVVIGEQWYQHAEGHPTSDPAVRLALTQAVDWPEARAVLTAGTGDEATQLAPADPVACPGRPVDDVRPPLDVEAAADALDEAGWVLDGDTRSRDGQPLQLTLIYDSTAGSGAQAAELVAGQWDGLGITTELRGLAGTELTDILFGSGDWDVAWVPVNVGSPDQIAPFLSGPGIAEGGLNFSGIENDDYDAGIAETAGMPGVEGCDSWLEAERHIIAAADVVPFANSVALVFGNGAEFSTAGQILPLSIRMTSSR